MMKREISTTYEREMSDPEFRARFEMEYQEFSLSEMIHQLMEKDKVSIRENRGDFSQHYPGYPFGRPAEYYFAESHQDIERAGLPGCGPGREPLFLLE